MSSMAAPMRPLRAITRPLSRVSSRSCRRWASRPCQGYHAAQVFEAVGLSSDLVDRHFTGTVSRIGGLALDDVQRECDERYALALAQAQSPSPGQLPSAGITSWRPRGEEHLITPQVIRLLQRAVREDDPGALRASTARPCISRDVPSSCATCSTLMRSGPQSPSSRSSRRARSSSASTRVP